MEYFILLCCSFIGFVVWAKYIFSDDSNEIPNEDSKENLIKTMRARAEKLKQEKQINHDQWLTDRERVFHELLIKLKEANHTAYNKAYDDTVKNKYDFTEFKKTYYNDTTSEYTYYKKVEDRSYPIKEPPLPFAEERKYFGLPLHYTEAELRLQYRRLVKVHHPDKGGSTKEFLKLTKFYNTLISNLNKK